MLALQKDHEIEPRDARELLVLLGARYARCPGGGRGAHGAQCGCRTEGAAPPHHVRLGDVIRGWLRERDAGLKARLCQGNRNRAAAIAAALGAAGLRAVAGSPCTHVLQASSAAEFVAVFAGDLGLTDDDVIELGQAIVRNRQEPGPLELLVHRAQATGRR